MKDPILLDKLLNEKDYQELLDSVKNPKGFHHEKSLGRYAADHIQVPKLNDLMEKLTEDARSIFKSKTLIPTYSLFFHYEGVDHKPSLFKHKDDNGCTYSINMCVYQNEPWDLFIDNKKYTMYPNEALAYYGNDQEHWREDFPNPETNYVAIISFHFAEPEHWYFTKGESYINVVRGIMTEDEWNLKNSKTKGTNK